MTLPPRKRGRADEHRHPVLIRVAVAGQSSRRRFARRRRGRVFFDGCRPALCTDGTRTIPGKQPMERPVASVCDVCGKGPGFGNNISHSHRRTRRRWNPNIQTVRAMVGRTPRRLNVCTSCIKAGKVTR